MPGPLAPILLAGAAKGGAAAAGGGGLLAGLGSLFGLGGAGGFGGASGLASLFQIGSGVAGLAGQGQAIGAQGAVAEFNARQQRRAARDALRRGRQDALDFRTDVARLRARQRVQAAAQGLQADGDISLTLADDTTRFAEQTADRIEANAAREAYGHRVAAKLGLYEADIGQQAGRTAQVGQLFQLGTSIATSPLLD